MKKSRYVKRMNTNTTISRTSLFELGWMGVWRRAVNYLRHKHDYNLYYPPNILKYFNLFHQK